MEEVHAELTKRIGFKMMERFSVVENNESYIRSLGEIETRKRPNHHTFENLSLAKVFKDIQLSIEGRTMMMRVHLKTKTEAEIEALKEQERIEAENRAKEEEKQKAKEKRRIVKKTKDELAKEAEQKRIEEERKEFMIRVDEKSLEEARKVIKLCLDQLAKLVIVMVSFNKPQGRHTKENSVFQFSEYLKTSLDHMVLFEPSCKIEDMVDRLQMEEFGDNACLVLENCYNEPEELGYYVDEEDRLQKVEDDQVHAFANLISEYAPCYIIEDTYSFFRDFTSITKIMPSEVCIFGPKMSNDVTIVAQAFNHAAWEPPVPSQRKRKENPYWAPIKKRSVALLGGDFDGDYVLAIDTILGFYDKIYLAGKLGIYFFMY
mmetsp:Transcript_1175/g.1069  ORF Transcript_1175/g.1069 Transcript_1175/m.1069 type:complete len:375 (-) Transcript_1175:1043-2167(-)